MSSLQRAIDSNADGQAQASLDQDLIFLLHLEILLHRKTWISEKACNKLRCNKPNAYPFCILNDTGVVASSMVGRSLSEENVRLNCYLVLVLK